MSIIKIGDIVARKSYGQDIQFKVVDIIDNGKDKYFLLKGIYYRLEADASEDDIVIIEKEDEQYNKNVTCKTCFQRILDRKSRKYIKESLDVEAKAVK